MRRPQSLHVGIVVLFLGATAFGFVADHGVAPSHPAFLGGAIEGNVTAGDGSALAGAIVEASQSCPPGTACPAIYFPPSTTETNASGGYRFELAPGYYVVAATAKGYESQRAPVWVTANNTTRQDFRLNRTATPAEFTISGTVRDARTQEPLGGATTHVTIRSEGGGLASEMDVTSDASGRFSFRAPRGAGVELRSDAAGYNPSHDYVYVQGDQSIEVFLSPRPKDEGTIRGRVTDVATGLPIANVTVRVHPEHVYYGADDRAVEAESGSGTASTTIRPPDCYDCYQWYENKTATDITGAYEIHVPRGGVRVSFEVPNYGQESRRVDVAPGETEVVDAALTKVPGRTVVFRGVVLDERTGEPVPGAQVSAENAEWSEYQGATTDRSGRFEIRIRPGYTHLRVYAESYGVIVAEEAVAVEGSGGTEGSAAEPGPKTAERIAPPPTEGPRKSYYPWIRTFRTTDGEVVDVTARILPKPEPTAVLVGYVVDATTNQAIPGAWVNVWNMDTGDWGNAQTDENGSWRVRVRPGYHGIQVSAEDHFWNSTDVRVQGPGEVRLDLYLEPGTPKYYYEPCEDCPEPMPVARSADAQAGGGAAPAIGVDAAESDRFGADGSTSATSAEFEKAQSAGPASYTGGAGGLPPYEPGDGTTNAVPAIGPILAALAVVGAAVLVAAVRRRL
ncbi:MAG: carboxypeptidase regulatory-like domain-containing protein [Methanobacteriota archaeon]